MKNRVNKTRRIVISLGSNLGDREEHIIKAIQELDKLAISCSRVSGVYETTPVDFPNQPDFLNAIFIGESAEPAPKLLESLLQIEHNLGRVRTISKGPRTIDLDLISVGDECWNTATLTLPHPRAHLRSFVLIPWLEVDTTAQIPGIGSIAHLTQTWDRSGLRLYKNREMPL